MSEIKFYIKFINVNIDQYNFKYIENFITFISKIRR